MLWFNLPRAVVCCVLTLAGGGAFAQVTAGDAAFDRFLLNVTGVGQQTVAVTGSGQLVSAQAAPVLSTNGGADLRVARTGEFRNASGSPVPIDMAGRVPKPALGSLLVRAAKLMPVVASGVALYDLFNEIGYAVQGSPGAVQIGQSTNQNIYNASCLSGQPNKKATLAVHLEDCRAQVVAFRAANGFPSCVVTTYTTGSGPNYPIRYTYGANCGITGDYSSGTTATLFQSMPPGFTEVPDAVLADAIATRSGWPSSSALAQATADALAITGEKLGIENLAVTGPATSPGTTSTTTNADGSTTTTTTTYNHTYTGPTINTTTQTITSTCTGGSCNTTTTTETPKIDEQPFTMPCGVAGTPACAVAVDETGMPTADDLGTDGPKDAEEDYESWIQGIAAANPFPDINWAFELPTACGVIPTPAFAPFMESIDVCQWQPMFHELMTVVWMLGGLFGAISLFMRNSLAT